MRRRAPPPPPPPELDPARLLRGGDAGVADPMKAYLRRTRPGEHQSTAAWYRLRPLLDGDPARSDAGAPGWRSSGAGRLGGVLAAALILLAVVSSGPGRRAAGDPRLLVPPASGRDAGRGVGPGGAAGWGELGAGGAEGSSGGHLLGQTAAGDAPAAAVWPRAG